MITEQSQSSIFRTEGWSRRLLVNNLRYCRMLRCSANLCKLLGAKTKLPTHRSHPKTKQARHPYSTTPLLMRPALLSKKGCPKTFCLDVIQSFQSTSSNLSVNMAPNVCSKCQWYILRPCRGSFGISFPQCSQICPNKLRGVRTLRSPAAGVSTEL